MAEEYTIPTVTTPATSFNLTTLLAVLADLNINDADGPTKVNIQRMIAQCSAAIANHCRRVFALQTYQEIIRLRSSREAIVVRQYPITEIVSITEDGGSALVVNTDYEADMESGLIRRLSSGNQSCWSACKIVIAYKAGYVLPGTPSLASTLPADLEEIAIRLIKTRRLSRERDPLLKSETVDGVGSADYWVQGGDDGNLPPDIADALQGYCAARI